MLSMHSTCMFFGSGSQYEVKSSNRAAPWQRSWTYINPVLLRTSYVSQIHRDMLSMNGTDNIISVFGLTIGGEMT